MKIFITTPSFARHGGIRIIMEWASRLSEWHDVHLHSLRGDRPDDWYKLPKSVRLVGSSMRGMDCLIITSPHSIDFQHRPDRPEKVFLFMQMVEHYFRPNDAKWHKLCHEFYTSPFPMFHGSRWGSAYVKECGRTGPEYYVANGVNLEHFPLEYKNKDFKTVLVEGWEATNPAKDIEHIAPWVAVSLKARGYKIIAYGSTPLKTMPGVVDAYYQRPSLTTMNRLYNQATILLKASRYDARALAPLEAGTKGTVTARAIIAGDDDLIDGVNCEKTRYDVSELMMAALRLLEDPDYCIQLAVNMQKYILNDISWKKIISKIHGILID